MSTWVGIEVTRQLRLADGALASAGQLAVGGVNLLAHQVGIAKQLTTPEQICILTPQGDESVLELIAEHGLRELAPFDFIAMLSERAKHEEEGAVVLLRQIAPVREAKPIKQALKMLKKHPVVISASKPPKGHPKGVRPQFASEMGSDPFDDRCLAFEARRISQFSKQSMTGLSAGNEELLYINWEDFVEYTRPQDESQVAATLARWH